MDIFFKSVFWGSLIILLGLSIILNTLFRFDFPFLRVALAICIIYFGIRLLAGSFGGGSLQVSSNVFFSGSDYPDGTRIGFGEYLYKTPAYGSTAFLHIHVNAVFGSVHVIEKQS